jgi:hypothetical protein
MIDTAEAARLDTLCRHLDPNTLFTVARTTNRNVAVYAFDPDNVVRMYWRMFETEPTGSVVEEATAMERNLAFGVVRCEPVPGKQGHYELVIKAAPNKALRIFPRGHAHVVGGQFDHHGPGIVQRIFVHVQDILGGIPRIQRCHVHGVAPSGQALDLRIDP